MTRSLVRLAGRRPDRTLRLTAVAALATTALIASALPGSAQFGPKAQRREPEKAPVRTGPAEQTFPFGATWILSEMNGKPISGDAPSFTLDDKLRAVGFGGCNTFSMALYPIKEQKLAAGAIAVTRKSCGKDLDDAEHSLLVALHSLPKWHLEPNGDLTVTAANATTPLVFKRGL